MFYGGRIRNLEADVAILERRLARYTKNTTQACSEMRVEIDYLKNPEKAEAKRIGDLEHIVSHGVINHKWGIIGIYTDKERASYAKEVAEYYTRKAKELKNRK